MGCVALDVWFKNIAAGLLLLLAAGTWQSARILWAEATARPLGFRREALTADLDWRYRFTLGPDYELHRLLRQRLGPGSVLAVRYSAEEYATALRLESLLHRWVQPAVLQVLEDGEGEGTWPSSSTAYISKDCATAYGNPLPVIQREDDRLPGDPSTRLGGIYVLNLLPDCPASFARGLERVASSEGDAPGRSFDLLKLGERAGPEPASSRSELPVPPGAE